MENNLRQQLIDIIREHNVKIQDNSRNQDIISTLDDLLFREAQVEPILYSQQNLPFALPYPMNNDNALNMIYPLYPNQNFSYAQPQNSMGGVEQGQYGNANAYEMGNDEMGQGGMSNYAYRKRQQNQHNWNDGHDSFMNTMNHNMNQNSLHYQPPNANANANVNQNRYQNQPRGYQRKQFS